MPRRTPLLALLSALTALPALATAQSDGNPATSNLLTGGLVVPYDGFLMLDSTPLNGAANLRLELWDDATATTGTRRVWAEDQTVQFYNGRFSVGLGTGTRVSSRTLRDVVQDGEKLFLAIQIQDSTGSLVPLAGRQAIEPVPYATWSASGANFDVGGSLSVGGQVTIGPANNRVTISSGQVAANRVTSTGQTVAGSVVSTGQVQAGSLSTAGQVQAGSVSASGQVQAASVSATGQVQAGSLRVTSGTLEASQAVIAQGNISTSADLQMGGNDLLLGTNLDARGNGGRALAAGFSDTLVVNVANDFTGGTRVEGGLRYTGNFTGWTLSGAFVQNFGGTITLVPAANSVCFLTRFSTDHNGNDPGRMRCEVRIAGANWVMDNQGPGGNTGDVDCTARCITF